MVDARCLFPAGLPADPRLLSKLLDLLPLGVIYYTPVVDTTGTLTDLALAYLNPAAQRMTRLPAQPGTTYRQQFPTTADNGAWDFHRRSWLEPEPGHFQFYYDADGFDSYFRVTAQRLGEGLLALFTDTQDEVRSQAEQALLASQAREQKALAEATLALAEAERQRTLFYQVLSQVPAYVATFDGPNHVYSFLNDAFREVLTQGRAQVGHAFADLFPELVAQGFLAVLDGVYTSGQDFDAPDTRVVQRDPVTGQERITYVHVLYKPLHDAQGRTQGLLAFATDTTEQVRARQQLEHLNQALEVRVQQRTQALAEQQRLLSQILGQVPAAIATLSGPEHRFSFFNTDYQTTVGNRAHLGQTVVEAVPEAGEQGFITLLDHVYNTGEPFLSRAVPVHLKAMASGEMVQHYVDLNYQALYDEQRQVTGILAFIVDVTQGVLARQQVQQLNQQLLASNHALQAINQQLTRTNADLDTFVYAASHDLKSPIANIEGLLNALREFLPPAAEQPMVPRLVGMMEGAITRFQQTVGHLTDVSRLQNEEVGPVATPDLAAVLDGVRLDLLPLLESTRAELVLDLADCPPVAFSTKSLRSVLFNLLSNAVKYRAPDRPPRVHIRTRCTATQLVLEVQDNGLGLDAQQQAQLFAMFRRLHTHVEGSGVGLYLIKRTVENARGSIAVQSELGVGSTFTVTLPLA